MCEDDFFRFVPAGNNGVYDNIVLIAPDPESKHAKNFTGIIKTGDKCLPHSKFNPKQRRKIENFDIEGDGYILPATADRILWSDETFNIFQLAKRSLGDMPSVIKVASNSSKFSCVELSFGQNILVHSFGTESRISTYDITSSKLCEIPHNLECQVLWKGKQMAVKEVLNQEQIPVKVKVVHCNTRVDDLNGHVILLKGEVQSKFIVCSLINAGWIDQSDILVIPEAIGSEFRIGEGLRDGNEEEWRDVVGMMKRSVRHLNHDIKGYPEITQQDGNTEDSSSFLADSRIRLPCYENVEIDLMMNNNLKHIDTIRPASKVYENVPKIEPKSETLEYPTFIYKDDAAPNPSSSKPLSDVPPSLTKATTTKESRPQQKSELKKEVKQPLFKRFLQLNPQEVQIKTKNKIPPHPSPRRTSTPKQSQIEHFAYPDDLDNLSRTEVVKCFQSLGLGGYCRLDFDIDGRTLTKMNAKELESVLKMTPLDANKASRFIRGWRP